MGTYLTQITKYLQTQSCQIAVLVIAVAAAAYALRNKSAHVRYLLWLIVLAKCPVPPLLTIPLAVLPQKAPSPEPVPITRAPMGIELIATVEESAAKPAELPSEALSSSPEPVAASPQSTVGEGAPSLTVRQWLGVAWIAGTTVFVLAVVIKALRTGSSLCRRRKRLPAESNAWMQKVFCSLGFKTSPRVWLVDGIGQPFVWGLLRGGIYLPNDFVGVQSVEHRKGVLGHELSHVLRFDAAVNLFQVVAQAIFWFHPFVWWANKRIRGEREKCCDEMAIARLNAFPKEYSKAIVNTLIAEQESTQRVPSLAVVGPIRNIEERIRTIMKPGKKFYRRPSLPAALVALLSALLTVPTALVLTVRAETKAEETTPEPEDRAVKSTLQPTDLPEKKEDSGEEKTVTDQARKPSEFLHGAAAGGDIEQVKSLISKGADVDGRDQKGRTPLHHAAQYGHTDLAALLISKGADVNARTEFGRTALHCAAMMGRKEVGELLLTKGADVNARNKHGVTPLITSVLKAGEDLVGILLAKGADVNAETRTGATALHCAAWQGRVDAAKLLISHGANVNAKDRMGNTPLRHAAMCGYKELARLLIAEGADIPVPLVHWAAFMGESGKVNSHLEKGTDVDAKDDNGRTPLLFAVLGSEREVAEFLLAKGADVNARGRNNETLLHVVAERGRKDMAEFLIAKGAEVDAKAEGNDTPLLYAVMVGNKGMAETLLTHGANVNAEEEGGYTLLHNTVWKEDKDMAELLISRGANVNARDEDGYTPLDYAAMQNSKDLVELFTAKGAQISTIHLAAGVGDFGTLKSLIEKGTDVNAKDKTGRTVLQWALSAGQTDVAEFLIGKGADVNVKDDYGRTPLHSAARRGLREMLELLIAQGAEVNAKDERGASPLQYAKSQGHSEVVQLLKKHGAEE